MPTTLADPRGGDAARNGNGFPEDLLGQLKILADVMLAIRTNLRFICSTDLGLFTLGALAVACAIFYRLKIMP